MEDDRTAEAVDHLQAAARELLYAARSFLAVVEEVVEDRDRLAGAASSMVDLLRDGMNGAAASARSSASSTRSAPGGSAPMEPWERVAWGVDDPADDPAGDPVGDQIDDPADDAAGEPSVDPVSEPVSEAPAEPVVVLGDTPADRPQPRRVRRISVD